ncbi:MAG: polyphosphate kinase 2 [Alphaproteobacteria bacterium]|nr:polyphosphate kinase 2 [Alphaproteobacteria bacterium]
MPLPFDGAISRFYNDPAQSKMRAAIKASKKNDILNDSHPYADRWDVKDYENTLEALQIELVKLQSWAKTSGTRIAIVFEGRDAAGKGGTIKRFREYLNPRSAKIVALAKPSDREASQWYFQRYIQNLPSGGEIALFDRSWYNRGVIEQVFGFCTPVQRAHFFQQVNPFEEMLVDEGIRLFKIWLNVGRTEQLRRFLKRESDPLKQWKLSGIDVKGLSKWDEYSAAIEETFTRSHTETAPWTIVRSDDKRRARVAAIQAVLSQIDYDNKDATIAHAPDAKICGGPDLWHV